MSHLLLDSAPLVVIPELAVRLGLNEAIIVQQIHYWIQINERADRNASDGYYWTYNTYEQWAEQFPFWSVKTIKRTISRLESAGILITDHLNKSKMDQTKWYRIDYDKLQRSTPSGKKDQEVVGREGTQETTETDGQEGKRALRHVPVHSKETRVARSGHVDPIEVPLSGGADPCDPIDEDKMSPCIDPNKERSSGQVVPIHRDELTQAIPETCTEINPESLSRDDEPHGAPGPNRDLAPKAFADSPFQADLDSIAQLAAPLLRRAKLDADEKCMLEDLLATGVSPQHIVDGIRQAFEAYKPRYPGDRIYKLTYCRLRILQASGVAALRRSGQSRLSRERSSRGSPLVQPDKYEVFWERYRQRDGPDSH